MKRLLVCLLLVGVVGCGGADTETEVDRPPDHDQLLDEDPIVALNLFSSEIEFDDENEITVIRFRNSWITDAGLVHLKGLTKLKVLQLSGTQGITGPGLVHLKGLPNLKELMLNGTRITDAGLVHLKGLTNLETLILANTRVTGSGLVHLRGLTKLRCLGLFYSDAAGADQAIAELQKALPKCTIDR